MLSSDRKEQPRYLESLVVYAIPMASFSRSCDSRFFGAPTVVLLYLFFFSVFCSLLFSLFALRSSLFALCSLLFAFRSSLFALRSSLNKPLLLIRFFEPCSLSHILCMQPRIDSSAILRFSYGMGARILGGDGGG